MGIQIPMERGYFEGRTGGLLKSIGTLYRELFKTAEPIEMPFRIWTPVGLRLSSVKKYHNRD